MKKIDKEKLGFRWNVWTWDFNHDRLEQYDVVPTFIRELNSLNKNEKPTTKEEFEEFLKNEARYHFWAKCEYEMIIHSWPPRENETKVDVYEQLRLNWNSFVDIFWNSIERYIF